MERHEASLKINEIRSRLSYQDSENNVLVALIRDLWDGYPIADAQGLARTLRLSDVDSEREIKRVVESIEEDGGVIGGYEGDGYLSW